MNRGRVIVFVVMALLIGLVPSVHAERIKSDNIKRTYTFPYKGTVHPPESTDDYFKGGTDIDFDGNLIYAMQQGETGGVHIIKRTRKRPGHVKLGFVPCPGSQNDIALVKPGLVAIGYHTSQCGGELGGGIRLIDVSDPKRPKYLGAVNDIPEGTHTLTVYPGKPIIYASPGGLANSNGIEQIIDVSDPKNPEVVATFTPNPTGCHDLTFFFKDDQKLAFCAGGGETQIWDVSDPLAPVTITHIPHPNMVFPHSVAITHDGKYAFIGDENFEAHECEGGPTGAIWIYDISNIQAPVSVSYYSIPRGQGSTADSRANWCTAHLFNFIPGTYTLVSSWYAAGLNVIDFTDVTAPEELAFYMGTGDHYTNYWSAYWHDGRIYANDRTRGLDVFKVKLP